MIPSFDPDNITGKYTLDDAGNPVSEPDLMKWARWMEAEMQKKKRVASTYVGRVLISTVFLGIDHSFNRNGLPILWETMVFIGSKSSDCHRYSSLQDARDGHAKTVKFCKRHFIKIHCVYLYYKLKELLP